MASDVTTGDHRGPKASTGGLRPLGSGGDRRMLDKTLKRLRKLQLLSSNPRLGLKNSPPYLPDLVSHTVKALTQVWEPHLGAGAGGQEPKGDEADYLRVHVSHLLDKTERALLLFKEGRDKMLEEASNGRRNLTKLSLLFSHMLWELKALFPEGKFQGHSFRLTKTEAEEFWRSCFGKNYIFRLSCTKMGEWAIGHVTKEGDIIQTIPQNTPLYLYPDGRDGNPDLTALCEPTHRSRVRVTEEQYELYCEIGSTFQLYSASPKSDGHTCPFCRCDIRGTESIVVEGFTPEGRGDEEDEMSSKDRRLSLPPFPPKAGEVPPCPPPHRPSPQPPAKPARRSHALK
ncbi:hypothetical protein NHX12_001898, partial [Muraenolepis orangiensis]